MDKETSEKLARLKAKADLIKSGNSAVSKTGEIVDRRTNPDAMPCVSPNAEPTVAKNATTETPRMDAVRDYTAPEKMDREGCRLECELADATATAKAFEEQCDALTSEVHRLNRELDELKAKNYRLREDTQRLDAIESEAWTVEPVQDGIDSYHWEVREQRIGKDDLILGGGSEGNIREAIDAARKEASR